MSAVERAGCTTECKVYEIEPSVIRGLSKDCICPADGEAGSAYIDAIADQSVGTADYMLSYTWGYTLDGCAVFAVLLF